MTHRHNHHRRHGHRKHRDDQLPLPPPPPPAAAAPPPPPPPPPPPISQPTVTPFPSLPTAGPWSVWTLDSEERGFFYRSRIATTGQMEWQFSPPITSGTHGEEQSTAWPAYSYSQPQPLPPVELAEPAPPVYQTAAQYPTDTPPNYYSPGTASDNTDSDDDDSSPPQLASFTIPAHAIIDIDKKNNVKVSVPSFRAGETTLVWDRKHKSSHRSKMTPGMRVREWLHSEFNE